MSCSDGTCPAVRVSGLTKDFPVNLRGLKVRAVDGLDLEIEAGQVYGLLGPNGSGKSTTIKVILGLLEPTRGRCEVFGTPSREVRSRMRVGYLPEAPNFPRFLSGFELVSFYGRICGVSRRALRDRVLEVLEWVGLGDAAQRRVGTYSKGMLQRVGLAQALVHDPELLLLDEPTAGVDPVGSAEMAEMIVRLREQGKTVVLSSHLLAQIEGLCDRIAILDRGRLVLEGRVDELTAAPERCPFVVEGLSNEDVSALRAWLGERGARLTTGDTPRRSLDRLFLEHVGRRDRSVDGSGVAMNGGDG